MRSCGVAIVLAPSVLSLLAASPWRQERPGGGASPLYVAIMFYKQPDPAVRAKIIALEGAR